MAATPKGGDKSSGFVMKLYQMVDGAPDDICSVRPFDDLEGVVYSLITLPTIKHVLLFPSKQWTPDGESFRITNLSRLESETLPSYFRHTRFQSLVRQLNFYNVRR